MSLAQTRGGFILLEYLIALVVIGVIGVVGIKMLASLQAQNHHQARYNHRLSEAQNLLDAIQNYLLEARMDSIMTQDNTLSWRMQDQDSSHQVTLHAQMIYLDGLKALDGVSALNIQPNRGGFEITLCIHYQRKTHCLQRWIESMAMGA
ncbi:hypothetical protein BKH46_07910 [Helicobacter sp. 12S02634-8]|uniref:hypothetical protein n=1 Tax=Helicobacter sp. 12S02634-8 TaxID=1476199 RepID=UPI000BA7C343|nr:hypothetical protein [Helicobacter sp. 12S02634-8]PAF46384.1 hypothetical protein BKH46_07910 [Helicobacter sp. 12S02634-8]